MPFWSPGGEEFGRLSLGGSGAELRAGSGGVAFEASGRGYRIVADGEEIRTARPKERSIDELEISCGCRTYEAQVNLLRNRAVAYYPGGERMASISGGLTGRSYEALFVAEAGCALPVAVFLLWQLVTNRRRTYRCVGSRRGEG